MESVCALSLTGTTNPDTSYTIDVNRTNCTRAANFFTALTTAAPGSTLAGGYWFGIAPPLPELIFQASLPFAPFNGTIDGGGLAPFSTTLPSGPLGATFFGVTVEFDAGTVISYSTAPISATI